MNRILILLLAVCVAGCSSGASSTTGSEALPFATLQVRHENSGADFLVEDVTEFHFTGLDASGNLVYGKAIHSRREAHDLTVPLSVAFLHIGYYAPDPTGTGLILRQMARLPVDLSRGSATLSVFPRDLLSGETLPTTLVNNSQYALNVYVFGVSGGVQSYMLANGTVQAYSAGDTVPSVATVPAAGQKTLNLPAFQGLARVYFSRGDLSFSGWELAPPYSTPQLFDFVEYIYTSPTLIANTTCVDAFSLPFVIETTPADQQNVGGWFPPRVGVDAAMRPLIFQAVKALGAPWDKLIVYDGQQNPIRLLAPWRLEATSAGFPANVLDVSIANQWGKAITLNTYGFGTYSAPAAPASGDWTFTPQGGGTAVTFSKPDSNAVFACVLPLQTPASGASSRLNDILSAGLNRGTLLQANTNPSCIPFVTVTPGQPDFSPADFYLTSANVPAVNEYSKVLHQYSLGPTESSANCPGTGVTFQYGIAPDNEGNVSSQLQNNSVSTFTITVSSF